MIRAFASATLISLACAGTAMAADGGEYPSAVPTFEKLCLASGTAPADQVEALTKEGWQRTDGGRIDRKALGLSRSVYGPSNFHKFELIGEWSGTFDERPAIAFVARLDRKKTALNLCGIVVEDVENAMPYYDAAKGGFQRYGLKGKSVDLVHYFEFEGKLAANQQYARGEIFSRSAATKNRRTMHIYVVSVSRNNESQVK
jgi:hypothetical protein